MEWIPDISATCARRKPASVAFCGHHGRWIILLGCLLLTGCRSLRPSDNEGLFAATDGLSIDNIRGPLERVLYNEGDSLAQGEKFSKEALKRLDDARDLYENKRYRLAIKEYRHIAKDYPKTSIGEEAWFRIGEAHFALKEYADAQEAYDKLFKDYPSTRYVSDVSERLFFIARTWLEVSGPAAQSAIRTVSSSSGEEPPEPRKNLSPSQRYALVPNLFDKSRPMFDTNGRARMALKSIWLNDPTGPLADDALMLTAVYYLRAGRHLEADTYFDILRSDYPDSPHLKDAYVLGAHVKQMSYQGPEYDGTTLVAAEDLKQKALMLFPNSEDRPQIRKDLQEIYVQKARRRWEDVQLWMRKDNPRAVAVACMQLITEFPDTEYAQRARAEIRKIDRKLINDLPGMNDFLNQLANAPSAPNSNSESSESQPPPRRLPGI